MGPVGAGRAVEVPGNTATWTACHKSGPISSWTFKAMFWLTEASLLRARSAMSLCALGTSPLAWFTRSSKPPFASTSVEISGSSARWIKVARAAFMVGASRAHSNTPSEAFTPPARRTASMFAGLPVAKLFRVQVAFSTMMRSCSRPMSPRMGAMAPSLQMPSRMLTSRRVTFMRQMTTLFITAGDACSQSRRKIRGVRPLCSRSDVHSPMLEEHSLLIHWTAST
mmetsp:Transcript_37592/g.52196  ORF Transcript_37592/g.52196 Transcript_37592/m.52196 type:complete len:225 (-) Transcript_37592:3627-4301(-)